MIDSPASIHRRIVATLADYSIAPLIGGGIALAFGTSILNPLFSTVLTIAFWLSKSLLEAAFGTTPGKMLTHLHVNHDIQGERLSIYYSSARNAWILLEIIPLVGLVLFSFVAIFLVASCIRACNFVGLHDKFAHVNVLRKNEKHPLNCFKCN